jgi:hypothetical protein
MPENENTPIPAKKPAFADTIVFTIIWAMLSIAGLFAAGGLAVIAIKWFVSLIKGGL